MGVINKDGIFAGHINKNERTNQDLTAWQRHSSSIFLFVVSSLSPSSKPCQYNLRPSLAAPPLLVLLPPTWKKDGTRCFFLFLLTCISHLLNPHGPKKGGKKTPA